jgi:hypothetical protein
MESVEISLQSASKSKWCLIIPKNLYSSLVNLILMKNELLINLIFDNIEKSNKNGKLLAQRNRIFRKYYFSSLKNLYGGSYTEFPLAGKGNICIEDRIYSGEWDDEGRLDGKISTSEFNQENIFIGSINKMLPLNGSGIIKKSDCIFEGIWKDYLFSGIIKNISHALTFKGNFFYESEIVDGEGEVFYNDRIYSFKWSACHGKGQIISIFNNKKYTFIGEIYNMIITKGSGSIIDDGNLYTGEWSDSVNKGQVVNLNTNVTFEGEWDDFLFFINGEGKWVSHFSVMYIGNWFQGIGQGEVHSIQPSSNFEDELYIFKGTWNKYGHLLNGEGAFYNYDGNIFKGSWLNGNGKGSITFPNGRIMNDVEWDTYRRIIKGSGVYFDPDFRKYVGEINEGNGKGIIYSLDDTMKFIGKWDIDGLPIDGEGIFLFKGSIMQGVWTNSKFQGIIYS